MTDTMGFVVFVFAMLDLIFALLVWGWAMQVRREQRALASVERANIALASLLIIDTGGTVVQVNREVARMFGYEPFEVIGHKVNMLMAEPDNHNHDTYLKRYQTTGERRIIGKGRMVYGKKHDGTIFPVELTVSEMKEADGSTKYYAGHLRDVSHEQWAELAGIKR